MFEVELTQEGNLRIPATEAGQYFRWDRARVLPTSDGVTLIPTVPNAPDGLILKQRNLAGDRSIMIRELLPDIFVPGHYQAQWNGRLRHLEVPLGFVS